MTNVLVSHADEPLGRRIVKTLFHDPAVGVILAVGSGPAPRAFDRFLAGSPPRLLYARGELAKHRPAADLFRSTRFRDAAIDSVVHVPGHGAAADGARRVAGLPARTAETRIVLQQCLESLRVRSLVAIGSAFAYRLAPGNSNVLHESSELDLDPGVPAEIRSWIDCDMLLHGEAQSAALRVVLLRVPTVVASGGFVFLNPWLEGRPGPRVRPLGFDPLCAVVADKDVARAVGLALRSRVRGVFNVTGGEAVPLSLLARWTGRSAWPLPSPAIGLVEAALGALRGEPAARRLPPLRYGFTLDGKRAEEGLGFRPAYRVGMARAGDGRLRLETSAV